MSVFGFCKVGAQWCRVNQWCRVWAHARAEPVASKDSTGVRRRCTCCALSLVDREARVARVDRCCRKSKSTGAACLVARSS